MKIKHYFAGSQRVASKPMGSASVFNVMGTIGDLQGLKDTQLQDAQSVADSIDLGELELQELDTDPGSLPPAIYYFHPDHLGSSTVITDGSGYAYQVFLNLPFGETMAEQRRTGTFDNKFKFNGKELDSETGLYYYGARYYNPRTSVWLSVDPLAEKFPGWSPYNYTLQNPIRYTDPDGKAPLDIIYLNKNGSINRVVKDGKAHITIVDPNYAGKVLSLSSYNIDRGPINWNNRNRKVVANVSDYYRKIGGLKHSVGATYEVNEGTTAHTTHDNQIYVVPQANGRAHPSLNNKYNLQKTIFHENGHVDEQIHGAYQYLDHAAIYLCVMQSVFYPLSDEKSQLNDIYGFVARVQKSKDAGENGWKNLIDSFNNSNIKGGYKIQDRDSGGIKLLDAKGNEADVPLQYYDINNPHE